MANKEDNDIVELAAKAQTGDAEAQFNLAQIFMNQGEVKLAEKWLTAAATQDHTEAQYTLGSLYLNGATSICKSYGVKYIERIEELLLAAAKKGHEKAIIELAPLYLTKSLPTYDLEKAGEWALKAADTGNADSIYNLAELYHTGGCPALGTEPNLEKYEELLYEAANKMSLPAIHALGDLEAAKGTPEGDAEAYKYYSTAAVEDYAPSQFKVALCQAQGKGVEKNMENAIQWLTYVAERGYEPAIEEIRNNQDYELEIKPLATQATKNKSKTKTKKKTKR